MVKRPLVSVVVAAYNSEQFIGEALESLLGQTLRSFEVLVVDDCSTDGTYALVKQYSRKDPRIKLVKSPRNVGAAGARNIGLRLAKGKYVAIFDGDDISLPDRLHVQSQYLENNPSIFLVAGSFLYVDHRNQPLGADIRDITAEKMRVLLPKNVVIHNPTVMFRNGHGYFFREKFVFGEDYDFFLRMLSDKKNLVVLPHVVLRYRLNAASTSNQKKKILRDLVGLARKMYFLRLQGRDEGYDSFVPPSMSTIRSSKKDAEIRLEARYLHFFFHNGPSGRKFRQRLHAYWCQYGFFAWPPSIIYFMLSFFKKFNDNIHRFQ